MLTLEKWIGSVVRDGGVKKKQSLYIWHETRLLGFLLVACNT